MVGKYYVTDAHCHVYPDKIAALASANTDRFYNVTSSAYHGTVGELLKVKEESGIDRFIIQSVATTPRQVRSINNFISATVKEHNDCMTGLGTLHPDSTDLRGDVEHILELGLHGVKLHPDIQQFKIDDYRCLKIYELCEKFSLPILMHTGDLRYDFSNINRLIPVMKIYTNLTVVGAHLGSWSNWNDAPEKLVGIPNLYFDCSSCFHWIEPDKVKEIIDLYGVDRVMFGTDYPMWSYKTELTKVLEMDFTEEEFRKLLNENAAKVYGIK